MFESPYVLDNNDQMADAMLDALSAILDPLTRSRLAHAGIPAAARCLEVGAGNGSIALWLADQVGVGGRVVATDIKPHHIADHRRMDVVKHDVTSDIPLDGPFDLVHARLVLAHLPTRWEVTRRLGDMLRPGGALVIEDWGQWSGPLLTSPRSGARTIYSRYQQTLLEVFARAGNDPQWAAQTAAAMTDSGLVDIDVTAECKSWTGGSPGCLLPVAVSQQLRIPLLACGMVSDELGQLVETMHDPRTMVLGNVTLSTIGRRPF